MAERAALVEKVAASRAGKEDSVSLLAAAARLCCLLASPPPVPHKPVSSCRCLLPAPLQDERRGRLARLEELQEAVAGQEAEIAEYAGADPERYDRLSERLGGGASDTCCLPAHGMDGGCAWRRLGCLPLTPRPAPRPPPCAP